MDRLRLGGALAIALALIVPGAPAAAVEADAEPPLLAALAYVSADAEPAGLDFVDWAQLKALHGGAHITGASPLAERQRLMLDIAREEAASMPLGFDRLPRWTEAWGWDSTDLEWEARVYGELAVMRFGGHWDARVFHEALTGFDYRPEAIAVGIVYHPDPAAEIPWHLRFANMHGLDIHGRVITEPMVQVAISDDGHTVVFSRTGDAGQRLLAGLEADLAIVATGGFGRAADALDRPLAASILAGREACSAHTIGWLEGDARAVAASVAPLHRYDALAAGYSRAHAAAPPEGRYVFAYAYPAQALDDLAGRRTLVEEGNPYSDRISRYEDVAFGLTDAHVAGSRLILEVAPVGDAAVHVLRQVQISPILFATCGVVSGVVAA